MNEYIRRADEAAKAVRQAQKNVSDAERNRRKNLKSLETEIKNAEKYINEPRQVFSGISLYIDHLEYSKKSFPLNEHTSAEVTVSEGADGKEEKNIAIRIISDEGEFTVPCKADSETKARQFADQISHAGYAAQDELLKAEQNAEEARERYRLYEADYTEINQAKYELERKQDELREIEQSATSSELAAMNERNRKRKRMMIIAAIVGILLLSGMIRSFTKKPETPKETAAETVPSPTPAPTPTPTPAPTPEPTPEPTPQPKPASSGIRPEFKEMMDSYEAFIDEYIAYMNAIEEGDMSMDQMLKYYDFLEKYEDFVKKIDSVDESGLTDEEDIYYLEVTMRVERKLLEAMN